MIEKLKQFSPIVKKLVGAEAEYIDKINEIIDVLNSMADKWDYAPKDKWDYAPKKVYKTGDRTFCTKCGQKAAECRCEEMSNMVECPACGDKVCPFIHEGKLVRCGTGKVKKEIDIDDEIDNALDKCKDNNDSGEKIPKELEGRFTVHNILCIEANLMDCEEAERIEKLIRKCIAEEPKPSIAEEEKISEAIEVLKDHLSRNMFMNRGKNRNDVLKLALASLELETNKEITKGEKICDTCIHPCKASGKRASCSLYDSGEKKCPYPKGWWYYIAEQVDLAVDKTIPKDKAVMNILNHIKMLNKPKPETTEDSGEKKE